MKHGGNLWHKTDGWDSDAVGELFGKCGVYMGLTGSMQVTPDENRLIRFFRCLPPEKQFDILYEVGSEAVDECIPDSEINCFSELMPQPSSLHGLSWGSIHDSSTMPHLLYCAISESGEPDRYLLGTTHWDEDETIPRFCYGANREAERLGINFDCDLQFAKEYLKKWRLAIVTACEEFARPIEHDD